MSGECAFVKMKGKKSPAQVTCEIFWNIFISPRIEQLFITILHFSSEVMNQLPIEQKYYHPINNLEAMTDSCNPLVQQSVQSVWSDRKWDKHGASQFTGVCTAKGRGHLLKSVSQRRLQQGILHLNYEYLNRLIKTVSTESKNAFAFKTIKNIRGSVE